jgi:hypothetical protein
MRGCSQKKTGSGARFPVARNACNAAAATGGKISCLDVTSLTHEERDSFANFKRNQWPVCREIGGRFGAESPANALGQPQPGHREQISGDGAIKRRCRGRHNRAKFSGKMIGAIVNLLIIS